MPSLTTRKT